MDTKIPASHEVRQRLAAMTFTQMTRLSDLSGVPFTTLWKVRNGDTQNPRIDTVAQFMPHIDTAMSEPA